MKIMEEIRRINGEYPYTGHIKAWKEEGKKVIGFMCNYVPEELIVGGGALPLRLLHFTGELPLDEADAYLNIYMCSYSRSILQMALDEKFAFLDGFVSLSICDSIRRLADVWGKYRNVPLTYVLALPRKLLNPEAVELYRNELINLKVAIQKATGKEITNEEIKKAIAIYNVTRKLLREIQELRKSDNPPITGTEMQEVMNFLTCLPRQECNSLLERLLDGLRRGGGSRLSGKGKVRLMLSGNILNNVDFIRGIEELGGLVVADSLCTGTRYWWNTIDETKDPIEALSQGYLGKFGCPRMYPSEPRFDQILSLAKEYRVAGVISQVIRYCGMNIIDQVRLRDRFEENLGIPVLMLDVEYGTGASGQIKTRVQAFMEMLGRL